MLLFVFRDHPKTIRQRFRSVFVISLLAPLYVWLWADGTSDRNVSISLKKKKIDTVLSNCQKWIHVLRERKMQWSWLVDTVYTKGQADVTKYTVRYHQRGINMQCRVPIQQILQQKTKQKQTLRHINNP